MVSGCSNANRWMRRAALHASLWSGLVVQGCSCGNGTTTPEPPPPPTVTITFPAQADSPVTSADDINPADGIQVNVTAQVGNGAGQRFLLSNGIDRDSSGALATVEATEEGGQVVFPGYTLPLGEAITLRVALEGVDDDADCSRNPRCDEVTIRVVESFCEFFSPTNDAVLTEDQYPGDPADIADPFETDVLVDCRGLALTDNVALRVNDGRAIVAQPTENLEVERVSFPRVALGEGANVLRISPRTDAQGNNPEGAERQITVTVDTGRCNVALFPQDGSRVLADSDIDTNPINGMQANVSVVSDCPTGSSVSLFLRGPGDADFVDLGVSASSTEDAPEGTRYRFDSVNLPESQAPFDVQLVATVSGNGEEGASIPASYWVDSIIPQLAQVSPGESACFGPAADVDPATAGIQVNGFGTTLGAGDGAEMWVRAFNDANPTPACSVDDDCDAGTVCRAELCRAVATITGSSFSYSSLTLPPGDTTVEYVATDLAGNRSLPDLVNLTVFAIGPTVAINGPQEGALLGPLQDTDPNAPGVQLAAELTIENASFASAGNLSISGQTAVTFDPTTAVDGDLSVPISLQDGARSLRARVEDSCGSEVASPVVNVAVDSTPSAVRVRAFTGALVDRELVADGAGTQAAAVELDVVVGAAQADRTVTLTQFSGVDTSAGRECTGSGTVVSTNTVPADATGFVESAVALNEGVNCFTVESDGGFGVLSEVYVVRRVSSAPALSFADPVDNDTLSLDTDGGASPEFNYDVSLSFDAAKELPGEVVLQISDAAGNPVNAVRTETAAGESTVLFGDVSLPPGLLQLSATFTDAAGNQSSAGPIDVTVNNGTGPQFAIRLPEDGSLNARNAGSIDVELVDLGSPITTGLSCDLTLNGSAVGSPVSWPDTATPLTIPATVDEGVLTILASCDDGSAVGYSQRVRVEIEDDAPAAPRLVNEPLDVPGRLVFDLPAGQAFVNAASQDQSGAVGFQHDVRLEAVAGLLTAEGWSAELVVELPDATELTYTRDLRAGVPASALFTAVEFGTDAGEITFTATVIDALGRRSAPFTATLTIDQDPPVLVQTSPDPAQTLFTREDDETADLNFVDLTFEFQTDAAEDGQSGTLEIVPAPADLDPAGQAFTATVSGGTVSFGRIAFEDDFFSATATLTDAAGNESATTLTFEVRSLTPRVEFSIPSEPVLLNSVADVEAGTPGFQGRFRALLSGLQPGATVRLCSTVDPNGGGGTPCTFGFDGDATGQDIAVGGTVGEPNLRGVIVASGLSAGALESSSVLFGSVLLEQGEQWLHFEAEEPDLDPQVSSRFFRMTVDSEGPVVTGFSFDQNDAGNDPTDEIALAGTEGAVDAGLLLTQVTVTVTGVEAASADFEPTVEVLSNAGGTPGVVGEGTLVGGTATFTIALEQGAQLLTVRVLDAAGNPNDPNTDLAGVQTTLVDFTPPSGTVPEPTLSVYTSQNGSIDLGATPDPADDRLRLDAGVAVSVQVSDNEDLFDGTVLLRSFSDASRTTQIEELTIPIGSGVTNVPANAFPFAAGENYLRAIITDSVGNESAPIDVSAAYIADFRGPSLELEMRAGGSPIAGCDAFGGCTVATATPPSPGDPRTWLDTSVNDLFYSVSSCENVPASGESCPVSARLESRIVTATNSGGPTDTRPFSPVTGGAISVQDTAFTSFSAAATGELFDPGEVREVRLVATDANGNRGVSNSVFLDLSIDGVIVTVERLAAGAPSGDVLENDAIYGLAENEDESGSSYLVDYRVTVQAVSSQLPDAIVLTASSSQGSNTGMMTVDVSGAGTSTYVVDVIGVQLATSELTSDIPNTISVEVTCGAAGFCGERVFDGLIVDVDAPTYEFERRSLCDLEVPLTGSEVCALADGDPLLEDANIEDPTVARAAWSGALDADGNPTNGFSTGSALPLVLTVRDVEQAPLVELASTQGGLAGNQVQAAGCSGGVCTATFANLNVPTVPNGIFHEISVTFVDRAGNEALPAPNRVVADENTEVIAADVDVTPPVGRAPTVCIGESTTPSAITNPATDPATFEETGCATSCTATGACSRRDGEATLTFVAPADDGESGDRVASYEIHAFALETDYGGTTYGSCGDSIAPDSAFETTVALTPTVDPGQIETATVTGLSLPRAYCFVVEAIDDLGNSSPLTSFATERVLPWLTDIPTQGAPDILAFDPASPDIVDEDALAFGPNPDVGNVVRNLGDLDGDASGRDELVIVDRDLAFPQAGERVHLFYGRDADLSTPSVTIEAPTVNQSLFGEQVARGDFDGDGLNDLVVNAPFLNTAGIPGVSGGGSNGGAVFIWWGVQDVGISETNVGSAAYLPSVAPDVAIYGQTDASLGYLGMVLADVDGAGGDELVLFTGDNAAIGFSGDKTRFGGSPPNTAIFGVDLTAVGGTPNRPDFRLGNKPRNAGAFFLRSANVGDFNGDGFDDLALANYDATHADGGVCDGCGEVYIFSGGAGTAILGQDVTLSVDGSGYVQTNSVLTHVLRFTDGSGGQLGFSSVAFPDPTGTTSSDWLIVGSPGRQSAVLFRGGPSGLTPVTPTALAPSAYEILTAPSPWDGALVTSFGAGMCVAQNPASGRVDLMVLPFPGTPSSRYAASVYRWESDQWSLRSTISGRRLFGAACDGMNGYAILQRSGFLVGAPDLGGVVLAR